MKGEGLSSVASSGWQGLVDPPGWVTQLLPYLIKKGGLKVASVVIVAGDHLPWEVAGVPASPLSCDAPRENKLSN